VDEFGEMFAISTGHLPIPEQVRAYVAEALERFRLNDDGVLADQYPALAEVPKELFGISIASVDGGTYSAGDADYSFTMMSISKPFVFALLCEAIGSEDARATWRQRHWPAIQFDHGSRAQPTTVDESDGQSRCARHDQPRTRYDRGGEVAVYSPGTIALCWT
jgi:hypothetical protein